MHGSRYKLNAETLEKRRKKMCLNFALKCLKSEKFKSMFEVNDRPPYNIQKARKKFKAPFCHTSRYQKSSIPYMITLLNEYFENN